MAYDTNSLNVSFPRVGAGAGGANAGESSAIWTYRSADAAAAVQAAGYINDGNEKGLQVGDIVHVVQNGVAVTPSVVTVVAANGDVTLA